jgi:hypothetical protein
MWIIGLLGFYLIYLIEFRWYMVSMIKLGNRPSSAPMILLKPFAHYIVHALAICIFCFSTYCFYKVNPWMVLLSPALLFIVMMVNQARQSRRTNQIIAIAVGIQTSMERGGASQVQINDAICVATLGNGYDLGMDCDLKVLVKNIILPNLGLLASSSSIVLHSSVDSSAFEQHQNECAGIDSKIESTVRCSRMRGANK